MSVQKKKLHVYFNSVFPEQKKKKSSNHLVSLCEEGEANEVCGILLFLFVCLFIWFGFSLVFFVGLVWLGLVWIFSIKIG